MSLSADELAEDDFDVGIAELLMDLDDAITAYIDDYLEGEAS